MTRDCDRFQRQMLELAYNELDAIAADRLREHAEDCASCRKELEAILLTRKLAAQLPEPEPPFDRDAVILELAAEAAARYAETASDTGGEIESDREFSPVERPLPFLERLRSLLLKPALVTAGVACVVFVISFFLGRNAPWSNSRYEGGESGAPFMGPAAPIAVASDDATTEPYKSQTPTAAVATAESAAEASSAAQHRGGPVAGLGTSGGKLKGNARNSIGTAAGPPLNSAAKLAPQPSPQPAEPDETGMAYSKDKKDFPAAPQQGLKSAAKVVQAPAPILEEKPAHAGDDLLAFQNGMSAYDRGDCANAISALSRVLDPPHDSPSLIPTALHHIARCEKRTGRCGKALIAYTELLNRYPAYRERAEATWEAASCHRRLGHVDRAWQLLEELADVPGWSARARAEQENIEQIKNPN